MINFIISDEIINKKEKVYTIYYMTKDLDDQISIDNKPREDALNVFYGIEPTIENSIYIPYKEVVVEKDVYMSSFKNLKFINFEKNTDEFFCFNNSNYYINFDIISTAFHIIACVEEYNTDYRDSMNRFLSEYSYRKDITNEPVFDNLSMMLFHVFKLINTKLNMKDRKFRILLTHDVDNVDSRNVYILLHDLKQLIKDKKMPFSYKFRRLLENMCKNRYMMIKKCIELEKKYKGKSEFYFIQGKKGRFGSRYNLNKLDKEKSIFLENTESVIGLHTNFYSYDDIDCIKDEIKLIENYFNTVVKSCRNHYLRFNVPMSWKLLNDSGIDYDTTLGYSDRDGFRAGTSKCFLPFDIKEKGKINILEIPMINMDVVQMQKDISMDEKWQEIKRVLDKSRDNYGVSSILWHQCLLVEDEYYTMYEKILKYIYENHGDFITSKDLVNERSTQISALDNLFNQLV